MRLPRRCAKRPASVEVLHWEYGRHEKYREDTRDSDRAGEYWHDSMCRIRQACTQPGSQPNPLLASASGLSRSIQISDQILAVYSLPAIADASFAHYARGYCGIAEPAAGGKRISRPWECSETVGAQRLGSSRLEAKRKYRIGWPACHCGIAEQAFEKRRS